MSSEVEICNAALSHLGDTATVASISPPEGSAQSEHCARFYPMARNALLEMHPWNFCTRREALALLSETNDQWDYVYAVPNNMLRAISVLSDEASDDYSMDAGDDVTAQYSPQPYCIETLSDGAVVICTNQEDAVLRFTALVTDSTKFPPAFTLALTWLLASMLAGPVIKGDVGAQEGQRCYKMFLSHYAIASANDSNQRKITTTHIVPWLAGR